MSSRLLELVRSGFLVYLGSVVNLKGFVFNFYNTIRCRDSLSRRVQDEFAKINPKINIKVIANTKKIGNLTCMNIT